MKQVNNARTRKPGMKSQKGFSLLEVGLAIIIALIVAAIALVSYNAISRDQQAENAQKTLLALVSGAKSLGQGGRFTGLTTQVMIDSGKVPDGLADGAVINNPFGGRFEVAATGVAGGSNNAVAVCVTNVGRSECNSMVNGSSGAFGRIGVAQGSVASCTGTAGTSVKDRWAATPIVPTTASVTTACGNESNTLVFVTN